ncbi:CrcB family protein [Arthrobacter sp. ISL-65]|uniref:fluoride efflux transporter FluC n=1 Tax=Arthrobacter sp. ISL-65 TaxID=2819112 RepID=UPI001BE8B744|nr:CrcB family protein [Arthrobacter sp. ISL-65]MBT2548977.1 CrcB family protein [Arthrobacter sp. ISL-65]
MEPPTPETAATTGRPERTDPTAAGLLPIGSDPAETNEDEADAGTLGEARAHRPVHLHPGFVLVVITGGVFGALARYGLSTVLPSPGGWPLSTLIINLAGALLLGLLLEALVRRGPDAGRLRMIRLLAGTGFMGAFTTYSTLALETNTLLGTGRSTDAIAYVAATVIGGAVATVAGILVAAGHHTRMTVRRQDADLRPDRQESNR